MPKGIRRLGKSPPRLLRGHVESVFLQGRQEGQLDIHVVLAQGPLDHVWLPRLQRRENRPAIRLELVRFAIADADHLPRPSTQASVGIRHARKPRRLGTRCTASQANTKTRDEKEANRVQWTILPQRALPSRQGTPYAAIWHGAPRQNDITHNHRKMITGKPLSGNRL